MAHSETAAPGGEAPRLSLGVGLIVWLAVILVIAGFIAIGTVLKLAPLYAGFLFVWYWSSFEKGALPSIPTTVLGACGGVATAGLAQYAAVSGEPAIGLALLALILGALLCHIMGWLPFLFNTAFMLFLTVTTAPLLQAGENYRDVVLAVLLGAAYFGAIAFIGTRIMSARRPAATVPAADA